MPREVAIGGRHRKARVLHPQPRYVRPQRRISGRTPIVVLVLPETTNPRPALEAISVDPDVPQGSENREAGGARPDNRDVPQGQRLTIAIFRL